ncbi:EpsG family protein [Geopseudomonas sagittaria]|uniref:EpsG family protein n=1 Tax=Geopseudomonas sagittaria TaxID=1135990 RepID=A0A1I5VVR2_9GAMM|nr:EpsG family protein [Pseudomonas sagittaria]
MIEHPQPPKKNHTTHLLPLIVLGVAFYQPFGFSPDYFQYEYFFDTLRQDIPGTIETSRFEPAFKYLSSLLVLFFTSDVLVFSLIATIAFSIKLATLNKYACGYGLLIAITFYTFRILPLHELTQLRAALASSFIVVAFFLSCSDQRKKTFIFLLAASLFHFSTILVAPLILALTFKSLKNPRTLALAAAIIYITSGLIISIGNQYFPSLQMYETNLRTSANPLSPVVILEALTAIASLAFWKNLTEPMRRVIILQLFGLAIYYSFIDIPVISSRGRELFSVLWIFFLSDLVGRSPWVQLLGGAFVATSIALSIYLYFILDFFSPYYFS